MLRGLKMVVNGIDAEEVVVDITVTRAMRKQLVYSVGYMTGERNSQTNEDKTLLTISPAGPCL